MIGCGKLDEKQAIKFIWSDCAFGWLADRRLFDTCAFRVTNYTHEKNMAATWTVAAATFRYFFDFLLLLYKFWIEWNRVDLAVWVVLADETTTKPLNYRRIG